MKEFQLEKGLTPRFISFFEEYKNKSIAGQDIISEHFERFIKSKINRWIIIDEELRNRNTKINKAFKKLKSVDRLRILKEELKEVQKDIKDQVVLANDYGEKWTKQMDNAGLYVKDIILKNTIKWFRQLTVKELLKDYERIIK